MISNARRAFCPWKKAHMLQWMIIKSIGNSSLTFLAQGWIILSPVDLSVIFMISRHRSALSSDFEGLNNKVQEATNRCVSLTSICLLEQPFSTHWPDRAHWLQGICKGVTLDHWSWPWGIYDHPLSPMGASLKHPEANEIQDRLTWLKKIISREGIFKLVTVDLVFRILDQSL